MAVFLSKKTAVKRTWALASVKLQDATTDFFLSRQAMLCTPGTMEFYRYTLGKFLRWIEAQGITSPDEINARYVRAYLAELAPQLADTTLHGHARAVKTLLLFWHDEGYLSQRIKFDMPKIADKKLPCLDADQLKQVLKACHTPRDKALIMLFVDSGVRRSELLALRWCDVDMSTGAVKVLKGKGNKYRVTFCGAKTRRALLKYRRTTEHDDQAPIFDLTLSGLRSALVRIGKRAGFHITPHMLRRTFATLALRSGMSIAHLSSMLGHAEISTTQIYLRLLVDDLREAHKEHSPIDNL